MEETDVEGKAGREIRRTLCLLGSWVTSEGLCPDLA